MYWGILHPFTSGLQLLALFALALFLQQRLPVSEDAFHGFWVACLVGAGAAAAGVASFSVELALTLSALVSGLLVASAARLPLLVQVIVSMGCGLFCGYLSWPEPGVPGDMMFTALGAVIGSMLIFTAVGAVVGSVLVVIVVSVMIEAVWQLTKWPWLPIAVRVAASWVTAIAVLLGALTFRHACCPAPSLFTSDVGFY